MTGTYVYSRCRKRPPTPHRRISLARRASPSCRLHRTNANQTWIACARVSRTAVTSATVSAVACFMVGRRDIAVYDGSLSEWVGEGLPTTRGSEPASLD